MTLRTKSRRRQRKVWLCAALVLMAVYVILSLYLYGAVSWNPLDCRCHRLLLPLVALFILVARETRWDGIVRERGRKRGEEREKAEGGRRDSASDPGVRVTPARAPEERDQSEPAPVPPDDLPPGAELFERARAIRHQPIPDFKIDGEYLELIGESAAAGYAPALAKLGEYAMRRAAWVEAYYWMTLARRNGMHGLFPMLREIRRNWAMSGFPEEEGNVSGLFPAEAGSLGRALIHLDSGRDAAAAREFLKANHPEFL